MANPGDYDFYCEEALTGKTSIKKVYESEKILAFYHTKPKYNTHIIIIPKEHIHNLLDAGPNVLGEVLEVAQKILKKIDVDSGGGRLITNLGKFQETPHHIISDGNYQDIKLSSKNNPSPTQLTHKTLSQVL